jgi:cytochrome c556
MKKKIALLSVAFFAFTVLAFAADELRPAQKLMQERAAWRAAIDKSLEAGRFEAIGKDADALATQTAKVGEGLANPLAKELTLSIAALAGQLSSAAARKDAATVKAKLGEIKGKCGECHAKIRDKK